MPSSPGLGSCWLGPQPRALTPASLLAPTYWGLQGLKGLNGQQALRGRLGHARCWEQAMGETHKIPTLKVSPLAKETSNRSRWCQSPCML